MINKRLRDSFVSLLLIASLMLSVWIYYYFENLFYIKVQFYYLKGIFAIPIFYWLILLIYALAYSKIFNQNKKRIMVAVFLMGVGIQLFSFLLEMKISLDKINAFGRYGGIYVVYTNLYFISLITIYFAIFGYIINKIFSVRDGFLLKFGNRAILQHIIFFLPIILFSFYLLRFFAYNRQIIPFFSALISLTATIYWQHLCKINKKIKDKIIHIISNDSLTIPLIFFIAFVLRLFWAWRLVSLTQDRYPTNSDDGLTYEPFGALIAQGRATEIGEGALYWGGIGYWYFIGLIYKLFGLHNFYALTLFQSLLAATVPVCVYLIAQKIFDKTVGIFAALVVSSEMGSIFVSGIIGQEALYVPLAIITMTILIYVVSTGLKNKHWMFLVGAMFGLTNMARAEVMFFPFLLIILFVIYRFITKKPTSKDIFILSFCLILGLFLSLSIHGIRNYIYLGKFTFSTGEAAVTFTHGGEENVILDRMGFNPFRDLFGSLQIFINNPLLVSKLFFTGCLRRFLYFLFMPNFGSFDPYAILNPGFYPDYKFPIHFWLYVHILVIAGIIFSLFERKKVFLKSIIISYMLYIMLIYTSIAAKNPRHRAVLIPFFAIFFVYGLITTIRKLINVKDR